MAQPILIIRQISTRHPVTIATQLQIGVRRLIMRRCSRLIPARIGMSGTLASNAIRMLVTSQCLAALTATSTANLRPMRSTKGSRDTSGTAMPATVATRTEGVALICLRRAKSRGNGVTRLFTHLRFNLLLACAVFAFAPIAKAEEVAARVTYVAWRTLYINAGRLQGLEVGNSGFLVRDDAELGALEIAAVSDSNAVATFSSDSVTAKPGDVVRITVHAKDLALTSPTAPTESVHHTQSGKVAKPKVKRRFTGRLGLQTDIQNDKSPANVDYIQPGLSLKFSILRVAGASSDFRVKYRGRKISYTSGYDNSRSDWTHRFYEASLNFDNPDRNRRANLGRIQAAGVSGIGYIDGAYGEWGLSSRVSVGGFAGLQSELDLKHSESSNYKTGIMAIYRRNETTRVRTQATLAIAGEYESNEISREFIYQQFTHGLSTRFSLYESADININRDWKSEKESSTLTLANFLANVRYAPARAVVLTAGYDGRSRYYTWETRDTPDSLFDEAMQHGFRAGVELSILHTARISGQQSYRSDTAVDELFPSTALSLNSMPFFGGRVGINARYNSFENRFSTGDQRTAGLSFSPIQGVDLRSDYGITAYRFSNPERKVNSEWLRTAMDVNVFSGWYSSVNLERAMNSDGAIDRAFFEIGRSIR